MEGTRRMWCCLWSARIRQDAAARVWEFPMLATGGYRGTPKRTQPLKTPHIGCTSTFRDSPNSLIYRTSWYHFGVHPPPHGHKPTPLLAALRTLATPSPSRLPSSTQASASHSFRKKKSRLNYFIYKISLISLHFPSISSSDSTSLAFSFSSPPSGQICFR